MTPYAQSKPLHLRLPATSANLGPGFDAVGLAMALYLTIDATVAEDFHIDATGRNADLCAKLVNELDHVEYIKEETLPPNHAMEVEIRLCGPRLKGVMGGIAGRYLMDEYRRGACGTMPACEMTDLHVQVWDALDGGGGVAGHGRSEQTAHDGGQEHQRACTSHGFPPASGYREVFTVWGK